MLTRLCDRCGAPADVGDIAKTVIIPTTDPATNVVKEDCEILLKLQIDKKDLCDVCLSSAVWEFATAKLGSERLTILAKSLLGTDKPSRKK